MPGVMQVLHEIHTLRMDLAEVRQTLERLPIQLKGSQAQLNKKVAAIDALRDELKNLRKESDAKELALRTSEARLRDLRGKLNMTTNTKEFNAIKEEIARIEASNGEIENEGLTLLSDQEAKGEVIAAAEKELAGAKGEHDKLKEVIDYKIQKSTDKIGILENKIGELEKQLEPTPLSDYRRLVKAKGEKGLAAANDGVCSSCYTPQTPQAVQELISGRVQLCTSCGAMLYRVKPTERPE
jgi:predicted  nucleic acid-binding Zn-ribbon protein